MSVYLGDKGGVALKRAGEPIATLLRTEDVTVALQRLSFDFDPAATIERPSPLITGDQVEFASVNQTDFELVSGITASTVTRFVHVDEVGGIRLYDTYEKAVTGGQESSEVLVAPSSDIDITVDVVNVRYECLAQIRDYELTTTRETVDTSILGEEYRQYYDQGLISGQGQINAIWDYKFTPCDDDFGRDSEVANYFSELVIRFREGARFCGYFTIYRDTNEALWYECDCICTSVGMSFAPGQVIDSSIQFITTGQIRLIRGQPTAYLLLDVPGPEQDEILLEQGPGAIMLEYAD